MEIQPKKGGWQPGRISLGVFVWGFLRNGAETWAAELYGAYRDAVQAKPLKKGRRRRRVMSFGGFQTYLYMMRRLNLIEYTGEKRFPAARPWIPGTVQPGPAKGKAIIGKPSILIFRAVPGNINNSTWLDIMGAYLKSRGKDRDPDRHVRNKLGS